MTAKPVRLHFEAVDEMVAAAQWYEAQNTDAGEWFRQEVSRSLDLIREAPHRWPAYYTGTRHVRLHRFPFLIIYRELSQVIEVIAITHGHRRPGYWLHRMT